MSSTVFYADPGGNELATVANVFAVLGVPTDPTAVSVVITDPTGAAVTHTYQGASPSDVTKISTGSYQVLIPTTVAGVWSYEWIGTGTASDVAAGTWTASPLTSNQLYCTLEELKNQLQISDTSDDFQVNVAVQAACRSVDEICGRYFWRGTDTRTYEPESIYEQQFDDIVSVTTFKVDMDGDGVYEQTWTQGTDFALTVSPGQHNPAAKGESWPYTGIQVINNTRFIPFVWPLSNRARIQITGVFGWPAVPITVKQAALMLAARYLRLKDVPFGVAGFGEFGVVRVQPDPEVTRLLHRYITGQRVGV